MPNSTHMANKKTKGLLLTILLASLCTLLIFLPRILADGGRLTLISDFNHQQIPFNQHSHWALSQGLTGWDWHTDLGVNFIASFSFYTLGSPFFWLARLFKPEDFVYLVGWLYMAKYVLAAAAFYLWVSRYVKKPGSAVLGALLYAFSGFNALNLLYYHFHEVVAFFPLVLYGLDELILNNRRGRFALAIGLSALMNYYFFFGQVIFLVLYFCLRYSFPTRKDFGQKFLKTLVEGVIGGMVAAILLIPSLLFILNNNRLNQQVAWTDLFHPLDRYWLLAKSLLMPAESMVSQSTGLTYDFSSLSFYLPFAGAACLPLTAKRTPFAKILLVCLILAFLQPLNASFSLRNSFYYARWFYMPLALSAAVAAIALETASKKALRLCFVAAGLLTLLFYLSAKIPLTGNAIKAPSLLNDTTLLALAGYALAALGLEVKPHRRPAFFLALAMIFAVITTSRSLGQLRDFNKQEVEHYARGYLEKTADLVPETSPGQYERFYAYDAGWNLAMLNQGHGVTSFTSTYSPGLHDFHQAMGIKKFAASLYPESPEDILSILSVRYALTEDPLEGFVTRRKASNGKDQILVQEIVDYLPLGFPVDGYLTKEQFLALPQADRPKAFLAARLPEADAPIPDGLQNLAGPPLVGVRDQIKDKRDLAGKDFQITKTGFNLRINNPKASTYVLTIPYDNGWTAQVNGRAIPISKNLGFMALDLPAGDNRLDFTYTVPGLKIGAALSLLGLTGSLCLFFLNGRNPYQKGKNKLY